MHLYEKRPGIAWKGLIITVVVFLGLVVLFSSLLSGAGKSADHKQLTLLENAIRNAAVTSYAIDGHYPASLDDIVAEYGVIIDDSRFIVRYNVFAANVMPEISVIVKGENAS